MLHNRLTPDRKPFTNSFLSVCYTIVPCRIGNYTQTVSCRYDTQSSHDELESFCKQFPVAMLHNRLTPDRKLYTNSFLPLCLHNRPMPNRKLFANSFLPVCYTIGPCRIGNHSQTVSCRYDTQSFHVGQETFRKQFPVVINHIRVPPDILIPPWTLRFSGPAEYPP